MNSKNREDVSPRVGEIAGWRGSAPLLHGTVLQGA